MSKMTPYKRAVAVTGTYESGGETKKRYAQVGTLFKYEDGNLSLKIESIPVGGEWNGFVSFFDLDDKKPAKDHGSGSSVRRPDLDDSIPF